MQIHKAMTAERYFRRKNDIVLAEPKKDEEGNPLRSADNRIASNFYGLLVNQKAAYLFSDPPIFDVGSKQSNAAVTDILGDGFAKKCKGLCIHASNTCVGWLHVWEDKDGKFQYVWSIQQGHPGMEQRPGKAIACSPAGVRHY